MSNPFARRNIEAQLPVEVEDQSREVPSFDDGPKLICQICEKPCSRSEVEQGNPWVHIDEVITSSRVVLNYDHPARPKFIEVTYKEVE